MATELSERERAYWGSLSLAAILVSLWGPSARNIATTTRLAGWRRVADVGVFGARIVSRPSPIAFPALLLLLLLLPLVYEAVATCEHCGGVGERAPTITKAQILNKGGIRAGKLGHRIGGPTRHCTGVLIAL